MRGSHNDHGVSPWNLPRSARVNLAEEQVNEDGEAPQDEIVQPSDQGWDVRLFDSHGDRLTVV